MNMKISRAVALAALLSCFAAPAFAAKGVITVRNPNGASGKLLVSDPSGGGVVKLQIGDAIAFAEDLNKSGIKEGDLVSFDAAADGSSTGAATARNITLLKAGTVLTGDHKGNLTVGPFEPFLLTAAHVQGKVTNNGGTLVILGSRIAGTVVSIGGGSSLLLQDSTFQGKISSTANSHVAVMGCTVEGKLEVLSAGACRASGNTVDGKTNTPGCSL